MPVRATLEQLASGPFPSQHAIAELDAEPDLPALSEDVWAIFWDLHVRRFRDENGPRPFSWLEIQSYMGVRGIRLESWQLDTVFALDAAFLAHEAENRK